MTNGYYIGTATPWKRDCNGWTSTTENGLYISTPGTANYAGCSTLAAVACCK